MTREEAIKRIQQDLDVHKKYLSKEYKEALNMSIEALSTDEIAKERKEIYKLAFTDGYKKAMYVVGKNGGDLISRAEAIEAVRIVWTRGNQGSEVLREVTAHIKALPSVWGEWIVKDNDGGFAGEYYCGNCGKRAEVDLYGEWILSNYCPNCGARMDKERRAE